MKLNMQYKALPKAGLVLQLNLVGKLTKYTKSFTLKWALYLTFSWVGRPITSLGGATELRIYLKLNFQWWRFATGYEKTKLQEKDILDFKTELIRL